MKLNRSQQNAVDCIAFCTDLQQAKTMIRKEYMPTISSKKGDYWGRKTEVCSKNSSGVTRDQVKRVLKRLEADLSEIQFRKNGCAYEKGLWSEKEFEKRWIAAKKECAALERFCPWDSDHYAKGRFSAKKDELRTDADGFTSVGRGGRTRMSKMSNFAGWGVKSKFQNRRKPTVPKALPKRVAPKPVAPKTAPALPRRSAPKPVSRAPTRIAPSKPV